MKQGIITKTCAVAAALAMGVSLAACGGGSSADELRPVCWTLLIRIQP